MMLVAPLPLSAQRYRFKYYSHRDGLGEPEVHALHQDRTGFLWIGTAGGLFRYDGAHFQQFLTADRVPTSIEALGETPDGTLWVGTATGLTRLAGDRLEFVSDLARAREQPFRHFCGPPWISV